MVLKAKDNYGFMPVATSREYGISPVAGKENLKVWPKGEGTFCIAKGESQIKYDNKNSGNCHSESPALFQSQIPPEIHTRNHIPHAQSPKHYGSQFSFEMWS